MKTIALDTEFFDSNERNMKVVCAVICIDKNTSLKFNLLELKDRELFSKSLDDFRDYTILTYAAIAEARSLLSLGIDPLRFKWVDLYVEFRMLCNSNYETAYGDYIDGGGNIQHSTPPAYPPLSDEEKKKDYQDHSETPYNLVNAVYKCLNRKLDSEVKNEMRNLVLSKDLESIQSNMAELLNYCESDTKYLRALDIAITNLLAEKGIVGCRKDQYLRGQYAVATAICEQEGIPINIELLNIIIDKTPEILEISKELVNKHFSFFVPETCKPPKMLKNGKKFEYKPEPAHKDMSAYQTYVASLNIPKFPKTDTGKYRSDKDTLEEFGYWGGLEELWKHNKTDSSLKWFKKDNKSGFFERLGSDSCVRPYYGIFGTQTGRNAAKAKTFPLAMSSWLRVIIKPKPDEVIISSDFSQQEIYVAAILSGDPNLLSAYKSGDVYLAFAKQAGLVPESATKSSNKLERNLCKSTVLGLQFGMGMQKLQTKLSLDSGEQVSIEKTEELITAHKTTFSTYWKWVYEQSNLYKEGTPLITNDGFVLFCDNPIMTSVRNFPVQANAASITRLAIVKLVTEKIRVMCGLHDAVYVICKVKDRDKTIKHVEDVMKEATRIILKEEDTRIRIDTKVITHGDLWVEEKGHNDMLNLAPLLGLSYT